MSIGINVTVKGPILTGAAPGVMDKFIHNAIQAIVEAGEQKLDERLKPRSAGVFHSAAYASAHGYKQTGHYAGSIHGEVKQDRGKISDSGVVYGPWLEGVGTRNQSSRFKGYASFRKVKDEIDKEKVSIIRGAVDILMRDLRG